VGHKLEGVESDLLLAASRRARGWLYTSPFVTSAALLLEAEQLTFGDQAQRLRPAQPVLAGRFRSHRAVTLKFNHDP
jgi:hypothetical protein